MTEPTINEALDQFLAAQHERLAATTYARYADNWQLDDSDLF